jgi:hypothetical protein
VRKMSEDRNQKSGLKTDYAPGRLGRSNELFDRFEDDHKLFVVFLLERFDLASKIAVCIHEPSELHKGAHDRDIYFDGKRAAQHAGEHRDSLFSKGVGQVTPATAPGV